MNHHSHDHSGLNQKNLLTVTLLNFIIAVVEIVGGIFSNSIALLSDAVHNLGDAFAILIAYLAHRISKRQPDSHRTFGTKRVEIFAALFNAVVLIVITGYLLIEAYQRFFEPAPIKGAIMFFVALIGLMANILAMYLLRRDARKNINIRAAYLHLLGDSLSSVAVIIGSALVYFFDYFWVDPLITGLIGIYILKHAFVILKEVFDILMQSSPRGVDIKQIQIEIERLPQILNIHHVHIWNLTDTEIHFECHIDLHEDISISKSVVIRKEIEDLLKKKFHISHCTIQFEFNTCVDKKLIYNGQY